MKKLTSVFLVLCLLCGISSAYASGFMPSLTQVFGVDMPSMSYTLQRFADKTEELADGSTAVTYTGVTEADYDAFGAYLGEYGCEVTDYTIEENSIRIMLQKEGWTFTIEYNNVTLVAVLTYPEGCNEDLSWAQDIYNEAVAAMESGDYKAASAALNRIKGYKDVDSVIVQNDANIAAAKAAATAAYRKVGNYVTFGTYPQTASGSDKTPIEWQVLMVKDNRALLISRYGLDVEPYNIIDKDVTWETCTLRSWLNGTFYNTAFTKAERQCIMTTVVYNTKSQCYGKWSTDGGNNTKDKIFLLSYAEAKKFFGVTYDDGKNKKPRVEPTAYAIKRGAFTSNSEKTASGKAAGWWWLRSPGFSLNTAAIVLADGTPYCSGVHPLNYVDNKGRAHNVRVLVRPVFWINLESEFFGS